MNAAFRRYLISVVALICGLFSAANAAGTTLNDYTNRVKSAAGIALELSAELGQNSVNTATEASRIETIRKLLPESESVSMPAGDVKVDNAWLHLALNEYQRASRLADRQHNFYAVTERLSSIQSELDDLAAARSTGHSKDEDKRKLAEILSREEYLKNEPKESPFQRWIREFTEWLARMFPRAESEPSAITGMPNLALILQIVLYAVIILAIGFVIYRLLPLLSDRFRRAGTSEREDRVILGERVGADESAFDLFAEAERLAASGELRLAIRKGYIATLCELGDRKLIGLAGYKTNRDYLRDIRKREQLFNEFRGMTGEYEKHWYGRHKCETSDWDIFQSFYRRALEHAGRS